MNKSDSRAKNIIEEVKEFVSQYSVKDPERVLELVVRILADNSIPLKGAK